MQNEKTAQAAIRKDLEWWGKDTTFKWPVRPGSPSGVDIPVYLGATERGIGAIECKRSWDSQVAKGNSAWRMLYSAIGQAIFQGRAKTVLGYRRDKVTGHLLFRRFTKYPELPLAVAFAASAMEGTRPVLSRYIDTDKEVRRYLTHQSIYLIIVGEDAYDGSAVIDGLYAFQKAMDSYAEDLLRELKPFQVASENAVVFFDVVRHSNANIPELGKDAIRLALDIADMCCKETHPRTEREPAQPEMWTREQLETYLRHCASECAFDYPELLRVSYLRTSDVWRRVSRDITTATSIRYPESHRLHGKRRSTGSSEAPTRKRSPRRTEPSNWSPA